MAYIGDFALGSTFDTKFCTVQSTGAPITLAGSPVISAYPDNSTTELTAGITLTVDFDARTGMHNVRVVATSGNGYASGSNYQLVITTGTINSVSAVGYVIGEFSLEARSALRPTTAARTLDVATTGEAGMDYSNVLLYSAGPFAPGAVVDSGTAQSATATTLVIRAAAAFADTEIKGASIVIRSATAGAGQSRLITAWVNSTKTATVDAWTTTPTGTIVYDIFGSAPGSTTTPVPADVRQILGTAVSTPATAGILDTNVKNINNVAAATPGATNGILIAGTNAATTITGSLTTTFTGNLTGSVGSVTGAVGSVTGAVGSVTTVNDKTGYRMSATGVADILTTALVEAYAADGAAGTLSQILFAIQAFLQEKSVSGTTMTVKKLDGVTSAMTFTLDSATLPTTITRAT